jgi:hypothetical protein
MITASQTEILKSQRTCDHLTNPGLLIKLRELQVLSLLAQLVQVNVGKFALSQRMAESVAQGLHRMAHQSTLSETNEDLFHGAHLELQERMQNPIAFHAEMMSDIMYLQQALR